MSNYFRGLLFRASFELWHPGVFRRYRELQESAQLSFIELRELQNKRVKQIVDYCARNVPFYQKQFERLGISPGNIRTTEDLKALPILTKSDIVQNWKDFEPISKKSIYSTQTTGGSTGQPLRYYVSKEEYCIRDAVWIRGWGLAGYQPGDKVVILAGGSLVPGKPTVKSKLRSQALNFHFLSSYGMDEALLADYCERIRAWRPAYLRGYTSSLAILAEFCRKAQINAREWRLRGVFTTSEMLYPRQRQLIEEVFGVHVFNQYGLNDGSITAYECLAHSGMHIDMERSLLEITDEIGQPTAVGCPGKILATSFFNTATPFLRYDTGDYGTISAKECPCGCKRPLLASINGRTTDTIEVNGRIIGSPVLTVLMGRTNAFQYQIVQRDAFRIEFRIVPGADYGSADERFILDSMQSHLPGAQICFSYVNSITPGPNGKLKFIINEFQLLKANSPRENDIQI